MTITLFSWGYWGWGSATEQLVEAFDKAEKSREFRPPLFVDPRLRRQGRAKGFVGNAFRDLVGPGRYRWMQDLGNLAIATGRGGVQIKNPASVADLLDLAVRAADERRRVIFYCACEFPSFDGALACHHHTIADLLLAHAETIGRSISVVEWPADAPTETRISVDKKMFSAIMRGRMSVPFANDRLPTFAALPWASMLTVECDDDGRTGTVAVGPARFAASKSGAGYWYLPVIERTQPDATGKSLLERAARWRKTHGLDERKSR
ncbi:MAG: hypothetical protein Q7S58_02900 [Candidatus Binatus sp.]|uniref:hypothetical protein n=1 Tax=Candidatus Binatus sp. TaxID=2811406 RepID=UPI002727ED7B|nr:hypothetical protein [Candidatus Binatus sp.]MDO8431337.1 hypothetical protein [Candidatus Binatus sp.]